MKLGLNIKPSLTQTLTPQQIQYLKLLQLPVVQLEQHIKHQIESNPMLDEEGLEPEFELVEESTDDEEAASTVREEMTNKPEESKYIDEESDPFEFQKLLWEGSKDTDHNPNYSPDEDDDEYDMPFKQHISESEDLTNQLRMLDIPEEEFLLGEQIIGNIDSDGYLRRDVSEIIQETNDLILEINAQKEQKIESKIEENGSDNPAKNFELSGDSKEFLSHIKNNSNGNSKKNDSIGAEVSAMFDDGETDVDELEESEEFSYEGLRKVDEDDAEKVLYYIRHLDPPGIGSRNVRECLLSQMDSILEPTEHERLAMDIIENHYDKFSKKHYSDLTKHFDIDEETLKRVLGVIRSLNPKPGGSDYQNEINTVTPDFLITKDEDTGKLLISLNDGTLPDLQLNKAYEKMRKNVKERKYNKETRDWIRKKYDDAKFLIQAIKQRKNTMLMVMTAISYLQRDFFEYGEDGIKPLIYKAVANETGLDISTVCRIVNGKYVRTDFGTYELKYFFSESLPTDDGEEVSTRIIKQKLKDVIEKEDKQKPYSDQKLSKLLKELGFNVARRTVSKYREQLKIPVARLRKELA